MEPIELKEKFILLRAKGYSFDRIARELGKNKQTLVNWSREFEEEIANLKSMEIEALNERFFISKQHKIEVFGELLNKIKAEIEERDLQEVPTDKLMELFLKYYTLIESERIEPKFKSSCEINETKSDKEALDRFVRSTRLSDSKKLKAV